MSLTLARIGPSSMAVRRLSAGIELNDLFGADWGFAVDPTTGVRCWLLNERLLYIDREVYEIGCDIADTPALFDKLNDERIPNVRIWPMRGDSARPETISHMNRAGFTLVPATLSQI